LNPDKFLTQIHKKHNLPAIPDNFAEGYVLKPLVDNTVYEDEGDLLRICYKYKNKFFNE